MHIVLANHWFPPTAWGGIGMYNYVLARTFRELGHRVTVVAGGHSETVPAELLGGDVAVRRLRVRDTYRLQRVPWLGRYARPLQQLEYSRRVAAELRALHRTAPIDVVEFAEVGAEGFFYARAPRSAVVVRCHTPTAVLARCYLPSEMPYDTRLTARCEYDAVRRAHALTAPSRDMAVVIAAEAHVLAGAFSVIPPPVPLPNLPPCDGAPATLEGEPAEPARAAASPDSRLTVLFVGRLDRVKGVAVLAGAIPAVLRECPAARFIFAGEDRRAANGPSQRAELEAQLATAGAGGSAEFLGGVPQTELERLYREADLCVVPSLLYESFSLTCAQAMAAGKPVVASRIGGIPETVADGETGLLVTSGSESELAGAIIRLARDPQLRARLGCAGRAKVAREYDPLRIANLNLAVYERARTRFRAAPNRGEPA